MNKENLHNCGCEEEKEETCGCGCGCEAEVEEETCGCGCGCDDEGDDCGCDDEGCGCGCGEHDHESLVVDLEDENGNIVSCEIVDQFDFKGNDYVLVQNPNDGSVYLFKVVGEGDDGELVIPEDEEFEEVSAYYENSLSEEDECEE
jgi:uncharacterized protein YrzB (UPF0473 family)